MRHITHEKDRVARTRSGFIPEGDGVPFTHTGPSAAAGQKWAVALTKPPPRRFTAIHLSAVPIVAAMMAVVLIATGLALSAVLDEHEVQADALVVAFGALVIWTALLTLPALVAHRRSTQHGCHSGTEPQSTDVIGGVSDDHRSGVRR